MNETSRQPLIDQVPADDELQAHRTEEKPRITTLAAEEALICKPQPSKPKKEMNRHI